MKKPHTIEKEIDDNACNIKIKIIFYEDFRVVISKFFSLQGYN